MNRFNFPRFFKFFSNEWKMNLRQNALLWGAMALFAAAFCLLARTKVYGIDISLWLILSATIPFWIAQGFYISIQMNAFTSKVKKSALLLQPISRAEFLTTKMISCFIIFPLLYIAFIAGVAALMSYYNMVNVDVEYLDGRTLATFQQLPLVVEVAAISWPCATIIYWFGSFYFGKYAVIKSALAAVALYAGLAGFSYLFAGLLSGVWDLVSLPLFLGFSGYWQADYLCPGFSKGLLYLSSLALIIISVFKYKEKSL